MTDRYNGKGSFEEWAKEWAMEDRYNFKTIEKKWQSIWDEEKAYKVDIDKNKEKYYVLVEFPYPSGAGLHVGHPRSYTALDVVARKKRMQGFNVLYPMGFDAFGLPAENYAIKTGVHPAVSTKANIENFTRQLKSIGFSFDWDRAFNTCDPEYYKWTQWMFIKLFEKGLAYKNKMATTGVRPARSVWRTKRLSTAVASVAERRLCARIKSSGWWRLQNTPTV